MHFGSLYNEPKKQSVMGIIGDEDKDISFKVGDIFRT